VENIVGVIPSRVRPQPRSLRMTDFWTESPEEAPHRRGIELIKDRCLLAEFDGVVSLKLFFILTYVS
jgi:hypothetical protein